MKKTGGSSAVGVVTGTYQATITPTMGTKQMAQGPHIVVLEALNNNQQVRFHFEKFNAPMFDSDGKLSATARMPFAVSVDFVMDVKRQKDGSVQLQSVKAHLKQSHTAQMRSILIRFQRAFCLLI